MIEVENLTKDYGTVVAVKDVSFEVGKGEVVGFLGPNGAGKSTTMRIVVGFLGATSGRVRVNGHDIAEASLAARKSIGYMPEAQPLYPEMRVREYLFFRATLKGVGRNERKKSIGRAMELSAVTDMSETLIGHLSKGYRQRVGLADALVADPPLLILDEPTAGLDPNQIRDVRKLIRNLGKDHTILLSTHILPEVEATCDRALVIDRGKLVAEGSLKELRKRRRAEALTVLVLDTENRAKALLSKLEGSLSVGQKKVGDGLRRLRIKFDPDKGGESLMERAIETLVSAQIPVREARMLEATLEEIFAQLTHADIGADGEA